jgi:outer membrane lipoprotein-sorting protein
MTWRLDWGIVLITLLTALRPTPGLAEHTNLTSALTVLSTNIAAVESLETRFVQEKRLSVLDHVVTLKGKMYMEKPNRFAWHVFSPIRYSMVMQGETVRQWDAESKHESKMSLQNNPALQVAIEQMQQWFLGDYLRLRSDYRIKLVQEEPIRLTFAPLPGSAASDYVEHVTVQFREDKRYIDRIIVREKGGDETDIQFSVTILDQPIRSEAWNVRLAQPEDDEEH